MLPHQIKWYFQIAPNTNHLQNFEVDQSMVQYGKFFSLPRFGNFWVSVEKKICFVIVAKFWSFCKFLQVFENSKKFKKQKFLSFKIFQALVEFLYRIVLYQFFWGRNEMVQWMVKILQVLTKYCHKIGLLL